MGMDAAVMGMLERIGRLEQRLDRLSGTEIPRLTTSVVAIPATSTASAAAVDMAGATITRATSGRPILVIFHAVAASVNALAFTNWQLHLDGVNQANFVFDDMPALQRRGLTYVHPFTPLAAGSHTLKVQWSVAGGATVSHLGAYLATIEL